MSAVEEYRKFSLKIVFHETVDAGTAEAVAEGVRMLQAKADAEIAELEAENDNLRAKGTPGWTRLRELEAERNQQSELASRLSTDNERQDEELSKMQSALAEVTIQKLKAEAELEAHRCEGCGRQSICYVFDTWGRVHPDFACNRWVEREKP